MIDPRKDHDNMFSAQIASMIADVRELKNKQFLGSDSIIGYLTHSNNQNDFSTSLTSGQKKVFRLRFTHDAAQHGSIQQIAFFWSVDNPDVMAAYTPPWTASPTVGSIIEKQQPTDAYNDWIFILVNNGGVSHTAYVKVFFNGTDSGSWNITQIA